MSTTILRSVTVLPALLEHMCTRYSRAMALSMILPTVHVLRAITSPATSYSLNIIVRLTY